MYDTADPAEAPPRLFTKHGTVVYVDPASGELRHGPSANSPANARFVLDGTHGQIMYEAAGSLQPMVCSAGRFGTIVNADDGSMTPTAFELVPLDDGWVGLKANGRFLSAELGGNSNVTLSDAKVCNPFENFLLSDPPPERGHRCGGIARTSPSLGIACIETRPSAIEKTARAVKRTARCIRTDCVYWFSNVPYPNPLSGIEVVNVQIPEFTGFYEDISRIYLSLVPRVVATDFNLIVQADGFAVSPQAWDAKFWEYDYIGTAFPWKWGGGPYWRGPIVGNGSFSLRSRKLYNALMDPRPKWRVEDWLNVLNFYTISDQGKKFLPEDYLISCWYGKILEDRYGVSFCPPELANEFSVESVDPYTQYWLGRSFAFHGRGAAPHYGVEL